MNLKHDGVRNGSSGHPDNVIVLGLDNGLIVFLVGPGPGEENLPLTGPRDDLVVDELGPVVTIQSRDIKRQRSLESFERGNHVYAGVIAQHFQVRPTRIHAGCGQRSRELTLQCRPAMRDRVTLQKPRLCFGFITGFPDLDRGTQQCARPGGRDTFEFEGPTVVT